jgi:6-pyruvoyltetrahydropterin/6-carboxytetrahydropterin synthase
MYRSTKIFDGYSTAIRQWKASHSHCCLLHGYSFYFHVTFEADELDEMDWVADFGSFKRNGLKEWMDHWFDHTLLVGADDPMRDYFELMQVEKIAKVHFMEKMGCESLAKMVFDKFNQVLQSTEGGRVRVVRVECFEHSKNSGIYTVI